MGDSACRRCSECMGCDHHWLDGSLPDECPHGDAGEKSKAENNGWCAECVGSTPDYECKHCDMVGEVCDDCDEFDPDVECKACRGSGVVARERAA